MERGGAHVAFDKGGGLECFSNPKPYKPYKP